jgi:cbb3-type cytochrome oxidase maturation protein
MNILLLLIPISLLLLAAAVWAFAWAVRKGQFDDLDTPAIDILADDPPAPPDPGRRDAG